MQPDNWRDRLLSDSVKIRQAERVGMIQKLARQSRLVRRLVRKTQDGTLGQPTPETDGADDMIQVGDNHYHPALAGTGALKTAALLAGLLAGGGGIGSAVTWYSLQPRFDAVASPPPTADADTRYELRLVDDPP